MSGKHTPGPWRWKLNEKHKSLQLVGGKPKYDLTIIQPTRWGMGSATLFVRDTAYDGMNLLHKLHERRDWIAPFAGRAHHADWCADVVHPDMRLIAAAPELLDEAISNSGILQALLVHLDGVASQKVCDDIRARITSTDAAIVKATGVSK